MTGMALLSLAFSALSIFLLTSSEFAGDWHARGAGLVGVMFFGIGFLFVLSRAFSSRPALVLRHDGIVDDASGVAAGLVPWNEIEAAYVSELQTHGSRQRYFCILPRNVDWLLAQQNPWKAWLMRQNMKMVGAPVTIPLAGLSMPEEEFFAAIRARVPDKFRDRYSP